MLSNLRHGGEGIPAGAATGLAGRALLGWMDREEATRFLMEDCLFPTPLTCGSAEGIWESHKAIVESLPGEELPSLHKLPLSAADLKAARKFRSLHPDADSVVDFARLNPMDLVVHQLWVSTDIAGGYRERATPDKWLRTALLDPPSNPGLKWRRDANTIVFDLPHFEYFLAGPLQPDTQMRVSEAKSFITVAFHSDRALLLTGYHRTFACAQSALEAVNAPHGVLFGVSNSLITIGDLAEDVIGVMQRSRPPRMADFFDDRLFLPVTLRRRRYQMRIHCELAEVGEEETQTAAGQGPLTVTSEFAANSPDRNLYGRRNVQGIHEDAVRHYRSGRIDEAVALYERALFLKPDHAEAHNNVGAALAEKGRIDEAVEHYERALVLNPGGVDVLNNLAAALLKGDRIDDAMTHYRRALVIDPNNAEAHNSLGNIFKFQGKFDDARAHFERAIAIRPDFAEAHFNRSEIKTFHRGDTDLAALEALAGSDDLSANKALFIRFALAKALDDCGEYGQAFEHLRKGNDSKRRQIQYDGPGVARVFQRVSTVFDRSRVERFEGEGDPSSLPIFVLGMPRSGSTLIEQILASHPQIHCAGELDDLEAAARGVLDAGGQAAQFPEFVPALDGVILRRIGQAYLARLPALADGKLRIVDKSPGNFLKIGLIRLILPNARIIHTVRDPIDTCLSCYSKLFVSGQNFSYDLPELGRYYRCYHALMAHWRSVLSPGSMLDVSYEDVVDDLEGQARRMIDYCGLPWDDRCLSFHKTSRPVRTASAVQVRQPLFRSSLQRWRKYEADLAPLVRELGDIVPNAAQPNAAQPNAAQPNAAQPNAAQPSAAQPQFEGRAAGQFRSAGAQA